MIKNELFIAADIANIDYLKQLIKYGLNVNETVNDFTPLYIVSYNGCGICVQLLLKAGADPNLADVYGASPLFVAAQKGHSEIVKLLLDAGANISQRDEVLQVNALCIAAKFSQKECVDAMLENIAKKVLIMAYRKNMIFDTAFIVFKKCVQDTLQYNECKYCQEYSEESNINNPQIHSKLYKIFNEEQKKI
jgi:ankyrin repeat protein